MKRKNNKAIATLTLIVMIVTMMLPIGSNAAAVVTNPSGGTFNETSANDGTVTGTVNVSLEWNYNSADTSTVQSILPNGLKLDITGSGKSAQVKISTVKKVEQHNASDSMSFTVTFRTKRNSNYQNEPKTFNIVFLENPPLQGDGEPTGELVRGKIRVLEVYPSIMTSTNASSSSDPSIPTLELFNKLKGNSKYDVTSMSLNKFISLRDEINGSYDVVYFGRGTYCKNTVTDTYFGNDITSIRADKVLEYINAGQLCIFHDDAFRGSTQDGTSGVIPVTMMYTKFQSIRSKPNVKVVTSINDSVFNDLSSEYLKYNQRPILAVTQKPVSYRASGQPISSHNLTFEYGVYDPGLGEDDSLMAELYIDKNCNSLFESFERVVVSEVKNGEYDSINYNMPPDLTGIFFWKLVVTDSTTGSGAKSEVSDVIRVKGDELIIKVLQIKPNVDNNASLTELFNKPVTGGKPGETLGYRPGEFRIDVTEATVNEFNAGNDAKHLRDLNGNYDMLILGFADNYSDDKEFNSAAIDELNEFISTKQSVMFTHDSIHYEYNDALTNEFWDDAGQTIRGGRGETAGLLGFGTNSHLSSEYSALNNKYKLAVYQTINPYPDEAVLVRPVNSNSITLYPYNLETVPQNQRSVAPTHYQWFKLDLEDKDVIPLFNLYKEASGERVNDDAMNNYYTYTKDNITYSGTGHKPGYPEYEIKLFINTAFKAHAVANKKPIIELKEPTGNKFNTTTTEFNLVFNLDDDYDDKLQYWVEVDYDNDGTFEYKDVTGSVTPVKKDITRVISNRSTVGPYKIKITAKETSATGAVSVLEKVLECVNTPVISPTVSFTYASDIYNNPITSCLIGETVKINTLLTATGNLSPIQDIEPKYDLQAKYLSSGAQVVNKVNQNTGKFTFYPVQSADPASGINMQETLTVYPDTTTELKVTTKVKYNANGSPVDQYGEGTLIINDGTVKILVTDGVRKVKDVKISDGGSEAGKTSNAGTLKLINLTGNHQYSIKNEDIPAGYKLSSVTAKRMSDGTETTSDKIASVGLTGENFYWEVTFKLTLDLVNAKYYKMKNSAGSWSVSYLGADGSNYYLRCPNGSTARYLTRIQINAMDTMKVQGVKVELEKTKDKEGHDIDPALLVNAGKYARIIDDPVILSGTIPPELDPLTVKQLKADNGVAGVPADGTYAGKSYYMVIEIPYADMQKVRIKKITLEFEDLSTAEYIPASDIIFGEPATPLLR